MKFMKNSFAKKLIIVLVILLIFNIAVPRKVKAWDFAGILFKPISSVILSVLVTVDCTIGILVNGASIGIDLIGRGS